MENNFKFKLNKKFYEEFYDFYNLKYYESFLNDFNLSNPELLEIKDFLISKNIEPTKEKIAEGLFLSKILNEEKKLNLRSPIIVSELIDWNKLYYITIPTQEFFNKFGDKLTFNTLLAISIETYQKIPYEYLILLKNKFKNESQERIFEFWHNFFVTKLFEVKDKGKGLRFFLDNLEELILKGKFYIYTYQILNNEELLQLLNKIDDKKIFSELKEHLNSLSDTKFALREDLVFTQEDLKKYLSKEKLEWFLSI